MDSLKTTKIYDNVRRRQTTMSTARNVSQHRYNSQTRSDVEESEINSFLSDESSIANSPRESSCIEREMDETSVEGRNGSRSCNRTCSKKSTSSISTTEAWFKEFNQNTRELNKNNFDDDSETPYYVNSYKYHPKPVSNQQSSITSRYHQRTGHYAHGHRITSSRNFSKSPHHVNFHKKRDRSSGSDSYRSVIDDLTLKNQKLKQKLRKMNSSHAKTLHKEKLFEVRYYQMPREKRQELEEYLREFAAQLPTPTSSSANLTQSPIIDNHSITNQKAPVKASDKLKMKQVVKAIENVFTVQPSSEDHYLKDQEDSDPKGYVYLNLLTNMAQLHTMNVTLPFIKQAIRKFSNCLELNEDGTKVRWRTGLNHVKPDTIENKDVDIMESGGSSVTSRSRVSESNSIGDKQSDSSPSNPSAKPFQKFSDPTSITPSSFTPSNGSKPNHQQTESTSVTSSITHYRPVFLHRNNSSSPSSDESSSVIDQHDGPVIYYEGGLFCTDFSRSAMIDDGDDKQTSSRPSQLSGLDRSIEDDDNIEVIQERLNVPVYERATNLILGGNSIELSETSEDDISSDQEADDESPIKSCNRNMNEHPVDDLNSLDANNELNNYLMKKDIALDSRQVQSSPKKNYGVINDDDPKYSSSQTLSPSNISKQDLPNYKKLHTAKVPGVITEDNFMVLVQTSHPTRETRHGHNRHKSNTTSSKKISHTKESSIDDDTSMITSGSDGSTDIEWNNGNSKAHQVLSTRLFQLPPSMSPQPRISLPSGFKRTSNSQKTSSDSGGGSSDHGSSSSCSNTFSESSSSAFSRDNSYLFNNNTLLQLLQSSDSKTSQNDEVQDMELDSLSSNSSDPSPFINIDDEYDDEIEKVDDSHHHRENLIEESNLGKDLRLQDAVIEERRKVVNHPQEQNVRVNVI
ncbi:3198_t:CDS:2 [Funneliformis geosporum]|uniref:3198_t:CDS:1 n=1 Tax=Funneliformis geosporum TaxID=1117311 RepID=A0A9W4WPT8_9GLOM|nr:3198_t:CDS:2 [Funneliformis geosporum]